MNETILVFAFRYALGRMSTAPSIVTEELALRWSLLDAYTRDTIQEDIRRAINRGDAGAECHVEEWKKVLKL